MSLNAERRINLQRPNELSCHTLHENMIVNENSELKDGGEMEGGREGGREGREGERERGREGRKRSDSHSFVMAAYAHMKNLN